MAADPDHTDVRRSPIDYDAAKKGDYLDPDFVEAIVEVSRKDCRYSLRATNLAQQIERELWERGKQYTVCIRDHGIAILTDVEASAYNQDRWEYHQRGLGRSHRKMAAVDIALIPEDVRKKHDRHLVLQGATLAAIAATRREIQPLPVGQPRRGLPEPQ